MKQSTSNKKIKEAIERARKISEHSNVIIKNSTAFERDIRKRSDEVNKSIAEIRELKKIAKKTHNILISKD